MTIDQRGDDSPRISGTHPVARRRGDRTVAQVLQWAALAICCAQAGCVTVEQPTGDTTARDQGVYRTGSRLPTRDGSGTAPVGAISKDEWLNNRRDVVVTPPGGKGGM